MSVSMRDSLRRATWPGTCWDLVEQVDTSAFHACYRLDRAGRLVLLVYGYATEVHSGHRRPLLGRPRGRHRGCLRRRAPVVPTAGLVATERLAIDGTKLAADAAMDQNRNAQW